MCRLIFEHVHEAAEYFCKYDSDDIRVLDIDCWNHLINVWLRGMIKSLYTLLENTVKK